MSNPLELFRDSHNRPDIPTTLPKRQISALQNFITAAHDQLVAHQIDRDPTTTESQEPHIYATFMHTENNEVLIHIVSEGSPDDLSPTGLHIDMWADFGRGMRPAFSVQTAKSADVVKLDVVWKSVVYTPEELDLLAGLIQNAHPIQESEFVAIVGPLFSQAAGLSVEK